jgi:hypothetical protein
VGARLSVISGKWNSTFLRLQLLQRAPLKWYHNLYCHKGQFTEKAYGLMNTNVFLNTTE